MSRSGTNTSSPDLNGKMGAFAGLNGMLMQAVESGNFKTGLTPVGMGTPGAEGVSPLPSQLGGTGDVAGSTVNGSVMRQQVRDQEEERKLRLETIVRMLGERWGYVSREGVERCARRVGLECLWEDEVPGASGRTLSIAGNSVLVDVTFLGKGDEVGSVHLGFPGREEAEWSKSAEKGGEVLKRDLKGQEGQSGYTEVEPLVGNLERLARLDRLGTGGLNCFDAVEGVGAALRKVWELETKKRRDEQRDERHEDVELDVMCKDSGKPSMYAGGRLGLALQYWTERRDVTGRKRKADEMAVDGSPEDTPIQETTTWSATIECEPSFANLYPSVRVSSNWITEAVDKQMTDQQQQDPFTTANDSSFTWQDPPPTFISSEPSAPDAMNIDTSSLLPQSKTPDVRFVARLDPPVLVPLQTALHVYESVGTPLSQESIQPTTFDSLLVLNADGTPSTSDTERVVEREFFTPTGDREAGEYRKKHAYTLFTDPQAYARNVEDIPFSHPRQIVTLFPVLRQWAMVSSLLRRCLASSRTSSASVSKAAVNGYPIPEDDDADSASSDDGNAESDLENLLNPSSSAPHAGSKARAIDISLSLSAFAPRIRLTFERRGEIAHVSFSIGTNAKIADVDVNIGDRTKADDEKKREGRTEKVKKVLELSEDLGWLVEWMEW